MEKLGIPTVRDWTDVLMRIDRLARTGRHHRRKEHTWIFPPDCLIFKNLSGYAIPEGGVVWLQTPMQSDGETYSGYRPTGPYMQQLAVADDPVPIGQPGAAYRDGVLRMIVSSALWTALATVRFPIMGNSQTDSFEICRHFGDGPIIIWALDAVSPFVRAEFVR